MDENMLYERAPDTILKYNPKIRNKKTNNHTKKWRPN